jgi:hypothetical protein
MYIRLYDVQLLDFDIIITIPVKQKRKNKMKLKLMKFIFNQPTGRNTLFSWLTAKSLSISFLQKGGVGESYGHGLWLEKDNSNISCYLYYISGPLRQSQLLWINDIKRS